MTRRAPTIAILPFALPAPETAGENGSLARGLAAIIESRLRLIPGAEVVTHHLLFAPGADPTARRYVLRSNMWSVDEALELPAPAGVRPTHLLQGRFEWHDRIEVTIELIDVEAAFPVFRQSVKTPPARFGDVLFATLGEIASAVDPGISPSARESVCRAPTADFGAFHAYWIGISHLVDMHLSPNGAQLAPFRPFLDAFEADPGFGEARTALDRLSRRWLADKKQNGAVAVYALREGVRIAPDYLPFRAILGLRLFEEGQYFEARTLLESVYNEKPTREIEPELPAVAVRLATILNGTVGTARAAEFLTEAHRRMPEDPDVAECLGVILEELGRDAEAEACWRKVLEEHPERPRSLSRLGTRLWRQGLVDQAEILLKRAVASPRASDSEWRRLVDFYAGRSHWPKADAAATEWAEGSTASWEAWLKLAEIRRERGDLSASAFSLRQAEKLVKDSKSREALARGWFALNHPADHRIFEQLQASSNSPESMDRWLQLARRHEDTAFLWNEAAQRLIAVDDERALEAQTMAAALQPDSATVHNTLGVLLVGVGRRAEAIERFRRAVELLPTAPSYRTNLAAALIDDERFSEARLHLEAARALRPGDAVIDDLEDELRRRKAERAPRASAPVLPPMPLWRRIANRLMSRFQTLG